MKFRFNTILQFQTNPLQWRIIFYITAAFYFIGNLLFVIFGRTSPREWNVPTATRNRSSSVAPIIDNAASESTETDPLQRANSP